MAEPLAIVPQTCEVIANKVEDLTEKAVNVVQEHPVATTAIAVAAVAGAATCAYVAHENRLTAEKAMESGAIDKVAEAGGSLKTSLGGIEIQVVKPN